MSTSLLNSPPFHPISVAELEEARTSAEVELIVNRLEKLASSPSSPPFATNATASSCAAWLTG